jgi:5-methylthioadenosine/S-adenosylhomocysteine deaminase
MRAHGVPVGLGTDSVASNDRMDLLGEARQAALLQCIRLGAPDALDAAEVLRLATWGGAAALGLADRVGTLEAGKEADLCAFDVGDVDAAPVHDPHVTLVHVVAGTRRARLVTVAGVVRVRDGRVLDEDTALDARYAALGARLAEWRAR